MNMRLDFFIVIVSVFSLLSQPLFFSFMGLIGVEYKGLESSIVYVVYISLIAVFSLFFYFYAMITKGISRRELILILILIFLFCLHFVWVIFDSSESLLVPDFLVLFVLLGLPGLLTAATIIKLNLLFQTVRVAELMLLVIAFGIIGFSVLPTFFGIKVSSLAGATYQALSYYSAFTFGMLLVYTNKLSENLRFRWTASSWYAVLIYAMMLGCVLGVFIGGGRGAFILLIAYLLVFLASLMSVGKRKISRKALINNFLKLLAIILFFILFLMYFWEKDFVQFGFSRATQFISSDGSIDIEAGSSGRDTIYPIAIDYISENPIIGYGPFGFRDKTIHAHNFFLEVLLQFGFIGLTLFLFSIIFLIRNMKKNWSIFSYWVVFLFIYPLVMIMFSGAYLHSPLFLFCISFLMLFKSKPIKC